MSFLEVVSGVASAIDAISGVGSSIYNAFTGADQRAYQERMQREAWSREDNAVRRRVDDLKAAGLSPTLAAGSSAQASSPIQVTKSELHPTDLAGTAEKYERLLRGKRAEELSYVEEKMVYAQLNNALMDNAQKLLDIEHGRAQVNLLDAEVKNKEMENLIRMYDFQLAKRAGIRTDVKGYIADAAQADAFARKKVEDFENSPLGQHLNSSLSALADMLMGKGAKSEVPK